jgi:hypothetical protein
MESVIYITQQNLLEGLEMKTITKSIIMAGLVTLSSVSAATVVNVGGVNFDTDYVDAGDTDFGAEFKFTQWFGTEIQTYRNISNYDAAISTSTVFGSLDNTAGGSGYFLTAVGEVDRLNGRDMVGPLFMDAGLELTFAIGGIELNKDSTFNFSNGWGGLFVNSTTDNYLTPASSQAEVTDAQTGVEWLTFSIDDLGFTSGGVENGFVSASLTINGGIAQSFFDPQTIEYAASAFFNPDGKYSRNGNGQIFGNTEAPVVVSAPSTFALLGLGLIGFAARRVIKK